MPTQVEIANHIRVSRPRVSELIATGVIPRDATIEQACWAYHDRKEQTRQGTDAVLIERIRLTRAQAENEELEVAAKKHELLWATEVEAEWADLTAAFRARALALPGILAPLVMAAKNQTDAEAIIKRHIWEMLAELAKDERPQDKPSASGANSRAAADPDDQPVGECVPPAKPRRQRTTRAVSK